MIWKQRRAKVAKCSTSRKAESWLRRGEEKTRAWKFYTKRTKERIKLVTQKTFKLIFIRFLIQLVNNLDAFSRFIWKIRICCTFDQNQNSSWKTIDEIITTNLLVCTEIVRLWLTFAHCAFESLKHKVQKWLKCTKWKSESTVRTTHFFTLCINDSKAQCAKVSQSD